MKNKRTKHICIFGGPGIGKTMTALALTCLLKEKGFSCEYVSEFAKDLTWEEHKVALACQPLIAGEQIFRQHKVDGKVDFVVTDSPLLINLIHPGFGVTDNYKKWLVEVFNMFDNFNILLASERVRPYETEGRVESKERAIEMDSENLEMLIKNNIKFNIINVVDDNKTFNTHNIVFEVLAREGIV
jgi:hypothetical protein